MHFWGATQAGRARAVGLYLDPPGQALVFSVDENSQIQALDRNRRGHSRKTRPHQANTRNRQGGNQALESEH